MTGDVPVSNTLWRNLLIVPAGFAVSEFGKSGSQTLNLLETPALAAESRIKGVTHGCETSRDIFKGPNPSVTPMPGVPKPTAFPLIPALRPTGRFPKLPEIDDPVSKLSRSGVYPAEKPKPGEPAYAWG
jgi:hypothetical protein